MESPLETYWIMARVQLDEEILLDSDDEEDNVGPIVGYFQNFGVTAASEKEALGLVEQMVSDGEIDWPDSTISTKPVLRLDRKIIDQAGDWTESGVWYKSGRVFFPADSE